MNQKGRDRMVETESVTIEVPAGMVKYLSARDPEVELTRNALLLYPYILNRTISHGRAAEILGIRKSELIELYGKLGFAYFNMTEEELDADLATIRQFMEKREREQNEKSFRNVATKATLSNKDGYTIFSFGDYVIRFMAPYSLEYYDHIKEWDNGYLVVMTKYKNKEELVEEYIDLSPILANLYMDEKLLETIKEVEISNGRH